MSPRRRYRRSQNSVFLVVLAVAALAWYQGKIPGVPQPNTVLPKVRGISTFIPNISRLPSISYIGTFVPGGTPAPTTQQSGQVSGLGSRTKTSGCASANALPDKACTPGAIFSEATVAQICTSGYSSSVRDVPESEKDQVYAEYGIATHSPGEYEVDHLIPLELGGSNDIANLWPEPAEPRPGFHEKDKVENYLHDQVCSGALALRDAQIEIANNWKEVYERISR